MRGREFQKLQDILNVRTISLRLQGKGTRPHKGQLLTSVEERSLWEKRQLGDFNARVLTNTNFINPAEQLGLRGLGALWFVCGRLHHKTTTRQLWSPWVSRRSNKYTHCWSTDKTKIQTEAYVQHWRRRKGCCTPFQVVVIKKTRKHENHPWTTTTTSMKISGEINHTLSADMKGQTMMLKWPCHAACN